MANPENRPSLPEIHRSIRIPENSGFWRKMLAYAGLGYLVSVGYMDPGNWATDTASLNIWLLLQTFFSWL